MKKITKKLINRLINENKNFKDLADKYVKRPSCPEIVYKNKGWIDWEGYLGIDVRNVKTPEEYVKFAEKLANENNRILPCLRLLETNGYYGLVHCIRNYPELFKHIKQDYRGGKDPKEWVDIAEKLAEKNGGILPHYSWLYKNGYSGLCNCIKYNPELFKHMKWSKKTRTPEENVKLAEKLSRENGGILPSSEYLVKSKNSGLKSCMLKHPELFKHIKQEKIFKTPEEHVKTAEQLIKKNNGILPHYAWLKKNDYGDLNHCIKAYPELFKHIKQENHSKTPEEHVKIAKKLIKENGGILPKHRWLSKNGYNDLNACMKAHPELFKGIKQKYRKDIRIL
jgi:hypothetical protein